MSSETGQSYLRADTGNAQRLVDQYGDDLIYCEATGIWYVWDGRRWAHESRSAVVRRATKAARKLFDDADKAKNEDERKALHAHAVRSNAHQRINAMVELAKVDGRIQVTPALLDTRPMLLNVLNGTLHLETGELRGHDRTHCITKLAQVEYDQTALCPTWLTFLDRIFRSDAELIEFVQRAVGYSLTGSCEEEVLFFLYGTGANGKSTFLNTIMALLGQYACQAEFSTFTTKRNGDAPRNDLARLHGARLVCAGETSSGRKFDEALIKQVTGRDPVTCRRLYHEFFQYVPDFKLFLAANHKPMVEGTDEAIWRRICLIPFTETIPKQERDKKLGAKLLAELPGILNWALDGCLEWQRRGLDEPTEITKATQGYRDEMDPLAEFLEERCIIAPEAKVKSGALHRAYAIYCEERNDDCRAQNVFGKLLAERGFQKASVSGDRAWAGLKLKAA